MILRIFIALLIGIFLLEGCKTREEGGPYLFRVLDKAETGIDFNNTLKYDKNFNLFKYIYFYNGSGLGAGDFNNDGRIDLFFGSNQGQNRLFLNKGSLQFRDVTSAAQIPNDGGWTTGISVVDINNDGLLDVYVCRVGNYETLHSKNLLLINQGLNEDSIPVFRDEARLYGLDFSGFSTQAVFFDMDLDGDLDLFLLNHSVHENGNFQPRQKFLGTFNELSGDRLFKNNADTLARTIVPFTDVTLTSGINSSAIGYGLGVVTGDVNFDGYPDLYVANDFHENDYLYINQKDGTFKDESADHFMHTSQFSMGVDMADLNNDGLPEILSTDMLSNDPYILKRSLSEGAYDVFNYKVDIGYSHQYTRNNLQYNRGNGLFSEVGLYAGVAATDWSWSPLLFDFDNDGYKDIFITNGIPKRLNDIDYINFVSTGDVQQKIQENNFREKDLSLIDKFPVIKIPNAFYKNDSNFSFHNAANLVDRNSPTFSNGAVYADLDNDGDLDIVVNNVDEDAIVYENTLSQGSDSASCSVSLKGGRSNVNALGSRLFVFAGSEIQYYTNNPVKGFMSSSLQPIHVGFAKHAIDSAILVWPDNTYQNLSAGLLKGTVHIHYEKGLPTFNSSLLHTRDSISPGHSFFKEITTETGIDYRHRENHFAEFDREPLIPHMYSTEGPALAVGDLNGDGLDDCFFGSARNQQAAIYFQKQDGSFVPVYQSAVAADSAFEDVDACIADCNGDGFNDLVVVSGGNEYYGNDVHNSPRLYLNDGSGHLQNDAGAFPQMYLTASCVKPMDFDGDGDIDLFIGAYVVPFATGETPTSYLLKNDGRGHFTDVSESVAPGLRNIGFVTNACWSDIDKNGRPDLLVTCEWGGITAFLNDRTSFTKKILTDHSGWWQFVFPVDVDGDGDLDLIAGNLGLNSRLKASEKEPVRMYYADFDDNGNKEQILTYFVGGKEIVFNSKAELEKQMPVLKKRYLYAEEFAKSSVEDLLGKDKLKSAKVFVATDFSNAVFINDGALNFTEKALPWQAQLSEFRDAKVGYLGKDSLPDIFMVGNFYENNIEMGRYDADYGTLLQNAGHGEFKAGMIPGVVIKGEVRHLLPISIGDKKAFVGARNNNTPVVFERSSNK